MQRELTLNLRVAASLSFPGSASAGVLEHAAQGRVAINGQNSVERLYRATVYTLEEVGRLPLPKDDQALDHPLQDEHVSAVEAFLAYAPNSLDEHQLKSRLILEDAYLMDWLTHGDEDTMVSFLRSMAGLAQ